MRQSISTSIKNFIMNTIGAVVSLFFSLKSIAQDKKVDINVNTKSDDGGGFFMQPWVWVVGGAVFLLLLVALLRNNNSKS